MNPMNSPTLSVIGGTLTIPSGDLLLVDGDLVLPKDAHAGIRVDTAAPTYPWTDIIGQVFIRGTPVGTDPTYNVFRGSLRAYQFANNDFVEFAYHIPHDYAMGTDIFGHVHWAHNNASVTTGGVTWEFITSYAKGHNQAAFPAEKTTSVTQAASTVQYQHMVAETQLSTPGGSATLLDTNLIEPDGLVLMRVRLTGNTMNGTPEPFLFVSDLHAQSSGIGTKNKSPGFWG